MAAAQNRNNFCRNKIQNKRNGKIYVHMRPVCACVCQCVCVCIKLQGSGSSRYATDADQPNA